MKKTIRLGAIFLAVLPFQASAEEPSLLDVTEPRNAAAGFAITSYMTYADALGTHCSKLEGEAGPKSVAALSSWRQRNLPYLDAALSYVVTIEDRVLAQQGEEARRRFREERKAEFLKATHKTEAVWFPDRLIDDTSCLKLASHVDDGSLDFAKHEEFFPSLQELKAEIDRRARSD